MTVGYYTGTSTGPNDLIDKLRVALLAEGWTVDAYGADGTGYRLHVHKTLSGESCYFNFRSAINEKGSTITEDNYNSAGYGEVTGILVNGSTGYDAGQAWHKQTGYAQNSNYSNKSFACCMTPMSVSAIPAYYFFFVEDSVHIVVEITAGKFQFMSFGLLNKQGTFTGGQYFTASLDSYYPQYVYNAGNDWYYPKYFTVNVGNSLPNGAVRLTADGTTSWRLSGSSGTAYEQIAWPCVSGQQANITYTQGGLASFFWSKSPSAYNSMAAMCPIHTLLRRSDVNYSLIGWPDGVRFLNCTNYSAGEELTYGDETWMVFHADSLSQSPLNMYCGFAFLKDDGS